MSEQEYRLFVLFTSHHHSPSQHRVHIHTIHTYIRLFHHLHSLTIYFSTVHRYSRSRSEDRSYTHEPNTTYSRTDKSTRPDLVRQPFSFAIILDRHLITNHQTTISSRLIPTTDYTYHPHSFESTYKRIIGYTYANTEQGAN